MAVAEGQRPLLLYPAPAVDYRPCPLNSLSSLVEILRDSEVETAFHLGGMLSVPLELYPWAAFESIDDEILKSRGKKKNLKLEDNAAF